MKELEFETEMSRQIFESKYFVNGETSTVESKNRVLSVVEKYFPEVIPILDEAITKKWVGLAGGIWRSANNANKNVSAINCTTLDQPEDNLESINEAWYWWAKFAAYGQGEGIDLSKLRPRGAKLHNTAKISTGAVSFMHTFDGVLNVIAQQGRRGASLISLHISHPDIPDFITVKDTEGVLETANISIHITDEFMNAVENDLSWEFTFENEYEIFKKDASARELFKFIARHAWKSGDPGVQYIDIARRYSNSDYLGYPIVSTNACSFTGETLITTKEGVYPIKDLVGKEVTIFDGSNWVKNNGFRITGYNQDIYRVTLESGVYFDVTEQHRFFTTDNEEKRTYELNVGDKLEYNIENAIYTGIHHENGAYIEGFNFNSVASIRKLNEKADKVYCTSVPTTSRFMVNSGIVTGNSEQWLDPHNVCILSSVNLAKFREYGIEKYHLLVNAMVKLLDAFRRTEYEEKRSPSELQLQKLIDLPRIGLGVTGLADLFIQEGIPYGSDDSIVLSKKVFGILAGEAYKTSYEIAKRDGKSFTYYDKDKYKQSPFVQYLLNEGLIEDYHLDYQAHVAKTTVAPNGTLTEIVEAGGGGVEPIFAKYFVRRERATTGEWKEWFTFNHAVRQYLTNHNMEVTKENADTLTSPEWVTAHTVDNMAKIRLMAEIQKYIDSAISITYNLEKDSTPEDIENIYMQAWKHGIKNVSVYREGSKAGVLITDANYELTTKEIQTNEAGRPLTIERVHAPKRPTRLRCDIHQITVNKEKHLTLVGKLDDGSIYEIFVTPNADNKIDVGMYKTGYIEKLKKGQYQLIVENGEKKCVIDNIGKEFDETYASLSRFISMGLRHGVDLEFIITQLQKDTSFSSFEKTVARVLKKYIKEGELVKVSEVCPVCGSTNLIYQSGCLTCANCNYSRCD